MARRSSSSRSSAQLFWKHYLSGADSCHFPRFEGETDGANLPLLINLASSTTNELLHMAARDVDMMSSALRVTWALLLRLYTGMDDVCFGFLETRRQSNSTDSNSPMPIMRMRLRGSDTLSQTLESSKEAFLKWRPYQSHSLDDSSFLAQEDIQRLFNSELVIRHYGPSGTAREIEKLTTTLAGVSENHVRLNVKYLSGGLSIFLEWWSAGMTSKQAKSIAETFERILRAVLTQPDTTTDSLDCLSQFDMNQFLVWNSISMEPSSEMIHELIRRRSISTPNKQAICAWDGSYSYQELDHISSKLAALLMSHGVGPESHVALVFDKTAWNVIAMLAVLKAGGSFVPLDPAYPIPRLQTLVRKVKSRVLLCSQRLAEKLVSTAAVVIPIDERNAEHILSPFSSGPSPIAISVTPSNAAYIIFTSGSTGQPKPTVIEHRAFVASAKLHGPAMLMTDQSRVLQFAAHTFDASLVEILTTLLVGGCICIPSDDDRLNHISKSMLDMNVNWAVLTPSFINFLAPSDVPGLKTLVLAGEAMSPNHVEIWSGVNLVNGYGPSEASVASVVNSHVDRNTRPNNIGHPVGVKCWVVDSENHDLLLPIGCVGELLIEGPTLAREYFDDDEKTSRAFITNPVWSSSGFDRRFYKTGDLVRWDIKDGSLSFLGRKDNQVKVHGQRVELGEIEYHLSADPAVEAATVFFPKVGHCTGRLVSILTLKAYATLIKQGEEPLKLFDPPDQQSTNNITAEIRQRIAEILPSHMTPTLWLAVSSLPFLPSGKLDRKHIATWIDHMTDDIWSQIMSPSEGELSDQDHTLSQTEADVRDVWSRVLNIKPEQIGCQRSFLSLGGDSITAMQAVSNFQKKDFKITVQEVLKAKSIVELAKLVRSSETQIEYSEEMELDFALSPIQQMFFALPGQGRSHFNQSFFLRLTRQKPAQQIRTAVQTIVKRHSMLRARFSHNPFGGGWQQRVTDNIHGSYRFRVHNILTQDDATPYNADAQRALDPMNGPIFAAELFQAAPGEGQYLFLVGHHLVIDLVSWRVILEELEDILTGAGGNSDPKSTIPFQTWCNLQVQHCKDLLPEEVLPPADIPQGNLSYWAMENQPNTYGGAVCEGFEIESTITSQLLTSCHDAMRTDVMDILASALLHSFKDVFNDRDAPALYVEGHGREPWNTSIDLSRTVGWFTTMYPIHVSPEQEAVDTIRAVKDFRRRVPANGRPYFASRVLSSKGRNAFSHHWPLEVTFNYLGQYQQLEREDSLLKPAAEMSGEARSAGGSADYGDATPRFGLFEISAVVVAGKLRFSFTFNRSVQHQSLIRHWISRCRDVLIEIATRLSTMSPELTLADFPRLQMSYGHLRALARQTLPSLGIHDIREIEDIYPCSAIQEGLLLSQSKSPDFYAVQVIYEVSRKSGLDLTSSEIAAAWRQVVTRHAMLRTIFVENVGSGNDMYNQIVLSRYTGNIITSHFVDDRECLEALNQKIPSAYDNGTIPPHRLTISSTSIGRVFCKLEIGHQIMDGASMSVIFRDLAMAIEGQHQNPAPLFSDYIEFVANQPKESGIEYWKSYLSDAEPSLFPVLHDGHYKERRLGSLRINFAELAKLQKSCEQSGITLSNAIHTAWALTLKCYTGQNDVCFGYLVSGRDAPIDGIDDAVGPMINTLVCRVRMEPEDRLRDTLDKVQEDYVASLPFKYSPLAEIQHALSLSGTSLFNTALSYRRLPKSAKPTERTVSFIEASPIYDPTEYNVSLNIEVSDQDVFIDLDHWTDVLSTGQADHVASLFVNSLRNITFHSNSKLADLQHFTDLSREKVMSWNHQMPASSALCVHEIFSQQAARRPEASAVCGWDANFTYEELDDLSDRLGHYLKKLGVIPETLVPLCFEKSAFTIVAMLGVLKAGGGFVPLDATHPKHALEVRIRDAGAKIVLTSDARSEMLEDIVPLVIPINSSLLEQLPSPIDRLESRVKPDNIAVVIYTSGSTGKPKGVMLTHDGLATSGAAHGPAMNISSTTRALQFAAYTFDNTLEEILTTLMLGGCVCVPTDHDRLNDLAGVIQRFQVNWTDLTPTVASFLNPRDVPTLRNLGLGGEAVTKAVLDLWRDAPVQIHCVYGPSECSINSSWNGEVAFAGEVTNIGHGIGCLLWIVDPEDHNRLLPIGCSGELIVDGPIVGRGYLNDPEKTAAAFIEPPPWAMSSGTRFRRLYKTGDLCRYNSDSSITYLGRKDTQVKLNGQRLELADIEHYIQSSSMSDMQSAVELVITSGRKQLAAFISVTGDGSVPNSSEADFLLEMSHEFSTTATDLQQRLAGLLPSFMVPTMYLPVSRMPLTSSGKLDRKRLRQLPQSFSEAQVATYRLAGKSGRAPESDVEICLQLLWSNILGIDSSSIGVDDSFFRKGGDSIGAMKLVNATRAKGLVLSIATIFQKPKLVDMAQEMRCTESTESDPEQGFDVEPFSLLSRNIDLDEILSEVTAECGISSDAVEDIYPCTQLQEGLIALSMKQPGAYVAQNTYRLPSNIDIPRFKAAWDAVVETEVVLRTRIVFTKHHGFLQVIIRQPVFWYAGMDLLEITEEDRILPPHNGGELMRFAILGEGTNSCYFSWTLHHATYDGWCIPTILDRVGDYYRHSRLPSTRAMSSYPRFIKYLAAIDHEAEYEFWRARLAEPNAQPFPALPNPTYQIQAKSHIRHAAVTSRVSGSEITMASTIRAAWALTLSVYSGSDDVIFGETLTGRDSHVLGIEDMVGPTLATVPTRVCVKRDTTVNEYLQEVQARSVEAIAFQHTGLQNIKRLDQDCATSCQFQNLIAINQGADDATDDLWNLQSSDTIGTSFFTYPLMVQCTVSAAEVVIEADYDQQILPETQAERLLHQFAFMIESLNSRDASSIGRKVGDIEMMSTLDRETVKEWNGHLLRTNSSCIHDMIHEMNRSRPSRPAVAGWDGDLTYSQLDVQASLVAHYLATEGVSTGSMVPFLFEKSTWAIVAMLGILKAGAAFVPLDPNHPVTRLKEILADIESQLVVTSSKQSPLAAQIAPKILVLDQTIISRLQPSLTPLPNPAADTAAYVLFTSGTTGRPKGTIIQHMALSTCVVAQAKSLRINADTRALQFASFTFDACIIEIITTLYAGGCVCVPSDEQRLNDVAAFINNTRANWTLLTPTFIQLLNPSEVPTLRTIVLGGEAASQHNIAVWSDKVQLLNAYGPTEAAVVATVHHYSAGNSEAATIGKAIAGRTWLVDPHNSDRLAPIGSVGELLLEGTLAKGYLKNPEKTDESFLGLPRWAKSGSFLFQKSAAHRFYRTGDLVKYDSYGSLVYVGRKDEQVKLHGQRMELGEVEHHLKTDQMIQHALVAIPAKGPCSKRLVAVLSLQELSGPTRSGNDFDLVNPEISGYTLSNVRDRLTERLPAYMIPSKWVVFRELPFLASSKLDRKRIVQWLEGMSEEVYHMISAIDSGVSSRRQPSNDRERKLQAILGKELNLPAEEVSLNLSFIHLGGDSISAMQVMSRCRAEGYGITVQDIIRCKSISQLAARISVPKHVVYTDEPINQSFTLSPIQQLYFHCVGECSEPFNQSVLLRLVKRYDDTTLRSAVETIVGSHHMLRARFFKDTSNTWMQRVTDDIQGSYSFRSHCHQEFDSKVMTQQVQETQQSLNIVNGPLFGVDAFSLSTDGHVYLSLVAHHLVVDIVSWRVIMQDFEDILCSGTISSHQSLPFQTWCRLQREECQKTSPSALLPFSEVPVADLAYWGMEDKVNVQGDAATDVFTLDMSRTLNLLGKSNDILNTEPVDLFLAAVAYSFNKTFSDRPRIPAIFNEGHGREPWDPNLDLSHTVGWFTTMAPISLPTEADGDFYKIARWIKDLRSRIPGKGRPYFASRLLTEEGTEHFASHWPMEIMFNYLGQLQQLERKDAVLQAVTGSTSFPEMSVSDIGTSVPRFALFEISVAVAQDGLTFSLTYNRQMSRQDAIRKWVQECRTSLEYAADQLSTTQLQLSLTDFPLLPLAYNGIEEIQRSLPKAGAESFNDVEDIYPCSPMQEGLLLSQLKNPQHYAFSCIFEARVGHVGTPDARRLAEAWQMVVNRHAVLRTAFIDSSCKKGAMDQVVLRSSTAKISWLQSGETDALQTLQGQHSINCRETQPPHRFTLCIAPQGKVYCKLEMSHAICDGTSIPIILNDLVAAYSGHLWTEPPTLFSDYIHYLQASSHDADIDYWKTYLVDIEPCYFPSLNETSKVTNTVRSFDSQIPRVRALMAFCTKHGITLSNTLQLIWALIIKCYTGNSDVCFGYVASGRDIPVEGIHSAVGAFINMLICKINLSDEIKIVEALHKIQADFVGSMAHQTCSLGQVQHELKLSGAPMFNTAFTYQKRSKSKDDNASSLVLDVLKAEDPSEYSITINVEATDDDINLSFTYWSHVLSDTQAKSIARTFENLMTQIIQPGFDECTVADLDFFNVEDREQVALWNGRVPPQTNKCVHELISDQAALRPKSTPAVCAWNAQYTYTELDLITNKVAAHLVKLGVGPEVFVPLCFEKSAYYLVSALSVMKAGGAFVPLDPAHPASRIKSLVDNVGGKLILCSAQYQSKAAEAAKIALVIDETFVTQVEEAIVVTTRPAKPDNAAYIIFTSGTTGMPKGTVIEHGAFCTGALAHSRAMNMTNVSRVLQFASHTFDASIMEILSTLLVGGCVCIPSDQERMNDLPAAMEKMEVNWTLLTPSVANTIKPDSIPSLRVLVTGGEAMSPGHIDRWGDSKCLVNAYGPSETSVIATISMKVDLEGNKLDNEPSNIGHAVGGRCWIVDPKDYNRLVPIGCVGELVVEGRIVAREYLNNAAKTASAFVNEAAWMKKHGFGGASGKGDRMYRTGDLVRYNANGSFSFVARKDTQIKLNGQRIELGEIEHHVRNNLPEHSQAAVELVTPAAKTATKALAAFYCFEHATASSSDATLSAAEHSTVDEILLPMLGQAQTIAKSLESALGNALPSYMIPALYIPVKRLPFTTAGKLDRQRLRNVVQALPKEMVAPYRLAASTSKKAPTSDMETKLLRLWESVLGLAKGSVGVEDNFFRVGGDSLAAMRLVSAATAQSIAITVINIFRKPKLSDMAKVCTIVEEEILGELRPFSLLNGDDTVDEAVDELSGQCRVPKDSISDAYPCSSLQEGLFTLSIKQPGAYVANNVFKLPRTLDLDRFKAAWQKTVDEVDILRTRLVHMRSSAFVQTVLKSDPIRWEHATDLELVTSEAPRLPAHNGGNLTKYTIIDMEASKERFLAFSIHHALYDGWSLPLVLKRVEQFYFEGETKLPKTPYAKFIKYLTDSDLQISEEFWKSRLAGSTPLSFPQPLASASKMESSTQTLTHTAQLGEAFAGMGITMPTLIRAAWAIMVAAYSGSDDVVYGETMTGRDVPVQGITDVLGPTLTTVPTRIQIHRTKPVMNFLEEIGRMNTDTIPHQHLGLQHIRRLDSDTSLACDFQNLLVIQMAQESDAKSFWEVHNNGVGANFFTYPLVIEARADDKHVEIEAHHDSRVISEWHVQRLLYQFESVLQQLNSAMRQKSGKVQDIRTYSPSDVELLQKWNGHMPEIVHECIHSKILETATRQPDTQAICSWDGDFTYAQFVDYSGRLAQRLTQMGVNKEVKVPICMSKSKWAVVAIMGVLMAGGAYVPLDPNHPASRHMEITSDVEARILLCSRQYLAHCSTLVDMVVPVDGETLNMIPKLRTPSALSKRVVPSNAAYVIYTSGSTGKPKGTVVEHRAFCSSSEGYTKAQLMKSTSRVFNFASFTFDVSAMEILSTLILGGCVCLPSDEQRLKDPGSAINSMGVSWAFLTPSVANVIEPTSVPSLDTLVCGGEAMSIENVLRWDGHVTLVNGYGPTEASVISVVNNEVSNTKDPSTIGRPTGGVAWVVDPSDHDRLAPVGSVGEMLLEGPFLAREYLNNEEKTREAFIENPRWIVSFNTGPIERQHRLYKTGDLVRLNENGTLVYIGRKDNQVKLNGQRLELGEIEHKMDTNSKIQHSLVVLPKKGPCKKRLVGVLSLAALVSEGITSNLCALIEGEDRQKVAKTHLSQIQETLMGQLPSYMVPSVWAVVESLPLLPSGKLDRRVVTTWVETMDDTTYDKISGIDGSSDSGSPATKLGKLLQEIIAKVLNIPEKRVVQNQSFLSLGGDSITAMQVLARCRKEKVTLSLNDILRSKSISQMALCAGTGDQILGQKEVVDQLFDLSPIQKLYMESASSTVGESRFNQSFTLRLTRPVNLQAIQDAIETIVAQHSMLRARFCKTKSGWQQKITSDMKSSYRFQDHGDSSPQSMVQAVGRSQSGLDIEKGPLFSVDHFQQGSECQVIVLVGHHLVVDMVSWRVILQDLEELLDSGSLSMDKPMSFQAWCSMQTEHAQKNSAKSSKKILPFKVVPADMHYWDMQDKANTYGDTDDDSFIIDKDTTDIALGGANKALGTEPIDLLLAVVAHSFSRVFNDRPTPTLWNEGHGRESWDAAIDLSRTVGWFTTIAPAHVQVGEGSNNIIDTIKRMKDARRQIPSNGRPYFAHRYLTPEGRWQFGDHMPMEIVFNYLGKMQQLEASDSLLQQHEYPTGKDDSRVVADVGSKANRFALFEISAVVKRDQLEFSFIYNRHMGRQDSIKAWMKECQKTVREAVHKLASSRIEPTLSDYPVLPITYDEMQQMVEETFPDAGIKSPEEVEDVYPCAPMQEGLFLSQLRDPSSYLFSAVYDVDPVDPSHKIDGKKLLSSWQPVVDRHPALRSLFVDSVCKGGVFDQIVLKNADSCIKYIECEDDEALDKLAEIKLTETNYAKKPRLPHQATVCVMKSGKVLFKLEVNHAVIDGGSAAVIIEDFIASYEDRLPPGEGPLYSEYIKYIRGQPPSSDVSFWKNYLEDLKPCYFPTLNTEFSGEKQLGSLEIDFSRYDELQELCSRTKVTFSNVLEVAWAVVLRKYTKSDDVCFGYLTAGRDAPVKDIETSVGAFINMLVCRIRFSRSQTLHQVFEKVQNDYLESIPYQHCSLAQMQHELGLEGKALFNTAMSIQNHSKSSDFTRGSITMEPCAAHDPSEYSVTVNVETMKGDEGVVFRYWSNTISHNQANALGDEMIKVLHAIIDNSQQTLTELDGVKEPVNQPAPPTVTTMPMPQFPMNFNLEDTLRKIVTDTVKDVVGQLLQSGELMRKSPSDLQNAVHSQAARMLEGVSVDGTLEDSEDEWEPQSGAKLERRGRKLGSIKENVAGIGDIAMRPDNPASRRATRNVVRHKLLTLWATLLDMEELEIGNEDSFFGLGGDSIIAMKMVGLAREAGLAMTVADIFRFPTFGEMASVVKIAAKGRVRRGSTAIDPEQAKREAAIQVPYSHFGLLKADDVDAFLQLVVTKEVGVFRGGILDVFPVTDFQALAVTGALLKSKWMLNYFFLDGTGPLDVAKLKQSAHRLVQNFDILRTVFIAHQDQFLQVVLRKSQPEFVVEDTDMDLDEFTEHLHNTDLRTGSRKGKSYVKFLVARQMGTDRHRIFIRLSHAQYDGVCFSTILQALRAGYDDGDLPYTIPFSNYVWSSAGDVTKGHYDYWRDLLSGSRMTDIVHRDGPNYVPASGGCTIVKEKIKVPNVTGHNITMATIVKAAWSLALGIFSAKSDVVFGHVISGRNSSLPGIEHIMGPCLNMVPVRVQFMPGWTAIDLLRSIQEQQIANMPYESLGFREITKHCTDWPDWTYFSTIVQHQNIDTSQQFELGGNQYNVGAKTADQDFADLSLLSTPLPDSHLELQLSVSAAVSEISPSFAANIMRLLADTVLSLAKNPHKPLPDPAHLIGLMPQTLDDSDASAARRATRPAPSTSADFQSMSKDDFRNLHDTLSRAWREVLRDSNGNPPALRFDSSFYDLGGDIMSTAQLASLLEQAGFKVRVDDLLEYPVMLEQLALLAVSERQRKKMEEARKTAGVKVLVDERKGSSEEEKRGNRRKTFWSKLVKGK
ncbi:nonribosomal peptide synthase [Pseudovirgaria hyperparasitica]|uniref:Nonribosomal peptide synthase n=1 Tax=Pseudovirgaria hyperparasitica TaxID=470096 RepID=A0A6A6W3V7_9PEZI|nr:nonribosomal peptide synthase [Pseudovirgaria hyperparasitica]KAF2757245.1 nonribosomal peptide synthase [Pseudovirgaria hyperparasitica]